jgi:bacteriocin-like protein
MEHENQPGTASTHRTLTDAELQEVNGGSIFGGWNRVPNVIVNSASSVIGEPAAKAE